MINDEIVNYATHEVYCFECEKKLTEDEKYEAILDRSLKRTSAPGGIRGRFGRKGIAFTYVTMEIPPNWPSQR